MRNFLTSACVVALMALCAANGASAAEFTVDSVGDQVDSAVGSNGCRTALDTCTLRAAIEESNASGATNDAIKLNSSFDGQLADTIELGSSLPTITDRVDIEGYPRPQECETEYFSVPGPCVGIKGPSGGTAFRVAAERVLLIGFAISDTGTAVEAVGAPGLEVWNDWFGLKLDGSAGALETGLSVDQESNGPLVGLSTNAKNIFAHETNAGLEILGADNATVQGNGFGVLPDGNSAAPNGRDIVIADAASGPNRVARGNWIGGNYPAEDSTSTICDVWCNVISGATEAGIDLSGNRPGQEPASGSTRISANYIGLNAFGTSGIPNLGQAILVGAAENVTIGGPREKERNLINGGAISVLAEPYAGNLAVENNWVGLDGTGTKMLAPPSSAGIEIEDGYQVKIVGNRIAMASGTAIEQRAPDVVIEGNAIGRGIGGQELPGGTTGIHLAGSCFGCNLVADNTIANSSQNGLLIETSRNEVVGNRVEGAGEAGIRIQDPGLVGVTRNLIGGDSASQENVISGSGGAAIEVELVTPFALNTRNEIARNRGTSNIGPFIDLLGGANGNITPPVFSNCTRSGASGSGALPGATVRVFRKSTSSPGELEGFLAEAIADEDGNWSVSYPASIPAGTYVAATQTSLIEGTATPEPADGTSELEISQTTQGDDSQGGESQLPAPLPPPKVGVPPTVVALGKAIPHLPILDRFDRSELPLEDGRWTQTRWTDEVGSSWRDPWHGFGATLSNLAGAFWNGSTFRDSGGPVAAAATLGTPPNYERWPNEYLSLWIDMPNPRRARSGYEVRFRGAKRKTNAYTVELSRWIGGHRKVLKKRRKVSLPANSNFAVSKTAGSLVVWTGRSTVEPLLVATDHTYSGGYVGIEANRGEGTAYDFRAGNVTK